MSATTINGVQRTFTASGTFSPYLALALQTDGKVAVATNATLANQKVIGFSTRDALADGDATGVALVGQGTVYATAKSTITNAGTLVYASDSGLVGTTATANYQVLGVTLESASANDVIEIAPINL